MTVLRRIAGVIAGLIAAFALVAAAEAIVHVLYPPPPGTNMDDFEQVKRFVASLPLPAYLLVLTGWLIGTFVATWLAAKIARSPVAGYIVGALLLAAGVFNARQDPTAGVVLDRVVRDLHRRDMGGGTGGDGGPAVDLIGPRSGHCRDACFNFISASISRACWLASSMRRRVSSIS